MPADTTPLATTNLRPENQVAVTLKTLLGITHMGSAKRKVTKARLKKPSVVPLRAPKIPARIQAMPMTRGEEDNKHTGNGRRAPD
jgi:hypothetical protein